MISDNLVTAHAHNVIILYGATVYINPVSAPVSNSQNIATLRCLDVERDGDERTASFIAPLL